MAQQLLPKQTHKDRRVARSPFDRRRSGERPAVPDLFLRRGVHWSVATHEALGAAGDHERIRELFPHCYGKPRVTFAAAAAADGPGAPTPPPPPAPLRVGCVLSGGQAPGGHNVIAGLFDYVKRIHPESAVIGFLDGPHGIYAGRYVEIDADRMDLYRNTGGFDLLSSGRHKIETEEQFEGSLRVCEALDLNGLVVIGGDDSNTNACLLAEYFQDRRSKCHVVGAPKTIDGDLRNRYIPISFGFDTACRTYAEQVSNTMADALAGQKYYHFVRLMGRAASNIALEVALQTQPNACLISEEVERDRLSLAEISRQVADVVCRRASGGKDYGVVLLPEGLIEFIPEFSALIREMNDLMAGDPSNSTEEALLKNLSEENRATFEYLPREIRMQLCMDRDPHGNVQVVSDCSSPRKSWFFQQ
jgi:diphosphate--fructose-6-phosphate 1-phosphotransferase